MLTLLFTLIATASCAPIPKEATPPPTGPAPCVVRLETEGSIQLHCAKLVKEKLARSVTKVENGVTKTESVEMDTIRFRGFMTQLSDENTKIVSLDGGELTAAAVARRAKSGLTALVSVDGKPIDKAWLRGLAPDTLLIAGEPFVDSFQIVSTPAPGKPRLTPPRMLMLGVDPVDGGVKIPENPVPVRGLKWLEPDSNRKTTHPTLTALEKSEFTAYSLDGKLVAREQALARLKSGGMVLAAGDTLPPDPVFLKPFQADILILCGPDFTTMPTEKPEMTR